MLDVVSLRRMGPGSIVLDQSDLCVCAAIYISDHITHGNVERFYESSVGVT